MARLGYISENIFYYNINQSSSAHFAMQSFREFLRSFQKHRDDVVTHQLASLARCGDAAPKLLAMATGAS